MLSVWMLALCLLLSGGISEGDEDQILSEEAELQGITSTTPLSGPIFSYAETNPQLQKYQDAWKFVTSNESFIMKYRNFNTNPTGENTTMCVSAIMMEMNVTTHYVLHNITYLNTTSSKMMAFNKTYYVISSDGYNIKNVLNGTVARKNESELYPFAFADKTCAVIRKDNCSDESFKACELWVYKTVVEEELSCCDFVFDLLCSRGYKQITYDSERCKD
ncbi:uncharacterized protein LOC115332805 [Ixodes scapularis]|uniref:uncharacterized protein LOC115332805 n=1 Tax=Ixodes scapularis TaxID=6945 RepID=UPI001A9DB47F|nr:uncharacterized protein LOC115332805 [Ixodes scapularis]